MKEKFNGGLTDLPNLFVLDKLGKKNELVIIGSGLWHWVTMVFRKILELFLEFK